MRVGENVTKGTPRADRGAQAWAAFQSIDES